MDADMHKEMLLQKRNLMMRLRMTGEGDEYKKYDLVNANNFDSELLERKMKKGHHEGY